MVNGDTLTVDATDGEQWRYVSLSLGRALDDSTGWEIAVRRHNITVAGALADLGEVQFEDTRVPPTTVFVSSAARENANDAIKRWYSYSFVTHLLRSQGHTILVDTGIGSKATNPGMVNMLAGGIEPRHASPALAGTRLRVASARRTTVEAASARLLLSGSDRGVPDDPLCACRMTERAQLSRRDNQQRADWHKSL